MKRRLSGQLLRAAALAVAAGGAWAAGAAGGVPLAEVRKEIAALRGDLAGLVRLRDELAASVPAAAGAGFADGCLELVAGKARGQAALTVQLLRRGGRWAGGVALLPTFALDGNADGRGLAIGTDGRLSGTAAVTLTPLPEGSRSRPPDNYHLCVPTRYECDVRAELIAGAVRGLLRVRGPAAPGALGEDELECAGRWLPLARPTLPPLRPPPLSTDPTGDGKWYETQATEVYEQVRALTLTRRAGLPFEIAIRQVPAYRPERANLAVRKKPKGPPRVEDIGGGLDLGLGGAGEPAADNQALLEQVKAMRRRVAAMAALVKAACAGGDSPPVQQGSTDTGDAEFGPWFAAGPLPADKSGAGIVPDSAGAAGAPQWRHVARWRITGPVASPGPWPAVTPLLPDIVPAFDAACGLAGLAGRADYAGEKPSPWQTVAADASNGLVRPPPWHPGDKYCLGEQRYAMGCGLDWSSFYAFGELLAPRDGEVWMGAVVNDSGALWINDRLVWRSGRHQAINAAQTCVFRAPLVRGRNALAFRCDDRQRPSYFGLWVCASGRPRASAEAAAVIARRDSAQAALDAGNVGVVGWRGDGCGRYPRSRPVTAWDIDRRINVLWRVPMPRANATPVLAGDRVLTIDEPYFLLCVDKQTGKLLWWRDVDVLELRDPKAHEASRPLKARWIELQGRLSSLLAEIDELRRGGKGGAADARQPAVEALRADIAAAQQAINRHSVEQKCPSYSFLHNDVTGHAFSTPATDGRSVWVKCGLGPIACFDLDGNRRWLADTGFVGAGTGACPSLAVAGGRVVGVFYGGAKSGNAVAAWDAQTGRPLWRTPLGDPGKWRTGSPVAGRLANGRETMDVIVTATSVVVRGEDGKVLLGDIDLQGEAQKDYDTPLLVGDVLYLSRWTAADGLGPPAAEVAAYRLIMHDRDHVGAKPLWRSVVGSDFFGGLLRAGGLIAGLTGGGEAGLGRLWRLRAGDGRVLPPLEGLFALPMADAWIPPASCGEVVMAADSWRGGGDAEVPNGMAAIRMAPAPQVVARNRVERMIAAPAFDGDPNAADRIYLRTFQSLTCLGYTGPAGRRYEAEVQARTVLGELAPDRPDESAALDVAPSASPLRGAAPLVPGEMIADWTFVGPLPLRLRDAARAAVGWPGWTVKPPERGDGELAVGGATAAVRQYADWGRHLMKHPDEAWRFGPRIDVAAATGGKGRSVSYWRASLANPAERTVRFELACPAASAWLSGVPLRQGRRVRLKRGCYSLVVEVACDEPPADGLSMTPRFRPSDEAKAELAEWLSRLRADRDILERAAKLSPDSDVGRTCARLLKAL